MPFLAVQNHTIFDFGGQTEKRVVREIGLRFFVGWNADNIYTNLLKSFIYLFDFFICQTSHVAIEDVAKGPCRYFFYCFFIFIIIQLYTCIILRM